jgi:hypothetical protein
MGFGMRGELLISERLYRALLYLYPKKFRAVYSQQMRLTFRDACRVAYRQNGAGGLLALWLPTLLDLFTSALEEWARQGANKMSKARLIALAGPLTILVGSVWVVASIGEVVLLVRPSYVDTFWDHFWFFPFFFSFVPMLFALIGTRLRFQESAGVPGRLGLVLSVAGCTGMIVFVLASTLLGAVAPEVEQGRWADYVLAACMLSLMIGYMLFGVDALRYRLLFRWNLLPLLVGLPTMLLIVPTLIIESNQPRDFQLVLTTTFLRFALSGVCWVLLGVAMMDQRQEPEPAAAI